MHITDQLKKDKSLFESKIKAKMNAEPLNESAAAEEALVEETTELTEKWGKETHVKKAEKGKWTNYSKAELTKKLNATKKKQEAYKEKHGKANKEYTETIKELDFAIRAKSGWGKVKESEEQIDEKWGVKNAVNPAKKGMWDGYTKAELEHKLSAAKKKQEAHKEKHGSADKKLSTLIKELDFAIRAKSGWGKVK